MIFRSFRRKSRVDCTWIDKHVQCIPMADTRGIMAERDGEIVGAIILDTWGHTSVQVHLAATTPMVWRHGLHIEGFNYVFNETDRSIVLGLTPASNTRALKLNKHLGFKQVYRIKDGFKLGDDLILSRIDKDECRFLKVPKHEMAA